jgi:hypothetical protein
MASASRTCAVFDTKTTTRRFPCANMDTKIMNIQRNAKRKGLFF